MVKTPLLASCWALGRRNIVPSRVRAMTPVRRLPARYQAGAERERSAGRVNTDKAATCRAKAAQLPLTSTVAGWLLLWPRLLATSSKTTYMLLNSQPAKTSWSAHLLVWLSLKDCDRHVLCC